MEPTEDHDGASMDNSPGRALLSPQASRGHSGPLMKSNDRLKCMGQRANQTSSSSTSPANGIDLAPSCASIALGGGTGSEVASRLRRWADQQHRHKGAHEKDASGESAGPEQQTTGLLAAEPEPAAASGRDDGDRVAGNRRSARSISLAGAGSCPAPIARKRPQAHWEAYANEPLAGRMERASDRLKSRGRGMGRRQWRRSDRCRREQTEAATEGAGLAAGSPAADRQADTAAATATGIDLCAARAAEQLPPGSTPDEASPHWLRSPLSGASTRVGPIVVAPTLVSGIISPERQAGINEGSPIEGLGGAEQRAARGAAPLRAASSGKWQTSARRGLEPPANPLGGPPLGATLQAAAATFATAATLVPSEAAHSYGATKQHLPELLLLVRMLLHLILAAATTTPLSWLLLTWQQSAPNLKWRRNESADGDYKQESKHSNNNNNNNRAPTRSRSPQSPAWGYPLRADANHGEPGVCCLLAHNHTGGPSHRKPAADKAALIIHENRMGSVKEAEDVDNNVRKDGPKGVEPYGLAPCGYLNANEAGRGHFRWELAHDTNTDNGSRAHGTRQPTTLVAGDRALRDNATRLEVSLLSCSRVAQPSRFCVALLAAEMEPNTDRTGKKKETTPATSAANQRREEELALRLAAGRPLMIDRADGGSRRLHKRHTISLANRAPDSHESRCQPRSTGGRRHAKSAAGCGTPWPSRRGVPQLLVLIALGALLFPSTTSGPLLQASANHGSAAGKTELWRRLLAAVVEPEGRSGTGAGGYADRDNRTPAQIEQLAAKLAEWPDQRRAALFYLDLTANRLQQRRPATATYGEQPAECLRSSLGELVSPSDHPAWRQPAIGPLTLATSHEDERQQQQWQWQTELLGRRLELNEVADRLLAKLNHEPPFLEAARLAVDVANLISRLLIQPESEPIRRIASPKFFKYLLESKLRQLAPRSPQLHSAGLVAFGGDGGGPEVDSTPAGARPEFAALVRLVGGQQQPELVDLLAHSAAGSGSSPNGYFGPTGVQPFLAKWAAGGEQLAALKRRLAQLLEEGPSGVADQPTSGASLTLADGRWFSPYLDCGLANRWLLTYSIPFFAGSTGSEPQQQQVKLRGVAFVSLDFGRTGLLNQCADEGAAAFLANTHQCARLQRSQCTRLAEVEDVRSGAYVCQCPLGGSVLPAERQATELYRDKLATQALSLAASNGSGGSGLEQLALELDERLTDKSLIASSLLNQQQQPQHHKPHNKQLAGNRSRPAGGASAGRYFALGARLDSDANLEWLVNGAPGEQQAPSGSPVQVCRLCRQASVRPAEVASRRPADGEATVSGSLEDDGTGESGFVCREFRSSSAFDWIRPLVVTLQSISLLITLGLVAILVRIRKSRIILVSGWLMLETTLIGALFLYTSVLVHYFEPTSVTCLLEPWLRELGFSIFYGSILIKLYRILTEFQTRKAHRVCFSDKDQIIYLLAIVLIVVGYMSAWTALMVDGFFFGRQLEPTTTSTSTPTGASVEPAATAAHLLNNALAESARFGNSTDSSMNGMPVEPVAAELLGGSPLARRSKEFSHPAMPEPYLEANQGHYGADKEHHRHGFVGNEEGASQQQQQQSQAAALLNYSLGGAEVGFRLASAVDQLAEFAPEQLKNFARNFNSFADIFSGLVETQAHHDPSSDSLTYSMRCRKLTWDYVTELSEMALLVFGIYLIYKLRNANSEVHKEKLVLCSAVFIELLASGFTYLIRHLLWNRLLSDQILLLYFARCQLTVTVNIALVFAPKLWTIGKSKPTLFSLSGNRNAGGSMRHRCHISCELHDHHLNDAMRLHQAMLSNAALDIGSINLADMDPDEIQAELKRVYAQLEVLKTKVMRRDNPHISKRRGGRKTGHRKFSLQAFHAKNLIHHNNHQTVQSSAASNEAGSNAAGNAAEATPSGANKLPTLLENDNSTGLEGVVEEPTVDNERLAIDNRNILRQVPVDGDRVQDRDKGHSHRQTNQNKHHHHHHHHHNHRRANQNHKQQAKNQRRPLVAPDPVSTSSIGCYDDDTFALNDSQSSGNVSPQRHSSFVCSQSSIIHPEDSSLN